ncbi:glycosyltransferase [Microbacterium sp. 2P01SA-2]|uniref:glycosyltransferase n=1 Tax=unclassified Microbacterium TaxID=2609290 RepID=UPI0039A19FE5
MPRVSVVTGFYNRSALLKRTIDSILAQTFEDFELLVFDDASSDDSAVRLKQLSDQYGDARFRFVVADVNRGFVTGLREAISQTSGDYIAIQGSGDESLPHRLERQVALLDERPEVGVVGGWYFNVQEGLGTQRLRTPDADNLDYEGLMRENLFSHGEVMIRREVYERAGGYRPEFRYAQDIDLWLRISRFSKFATVPEPIYRRYVQFDGVSYVPKKIVEQSCYSVAARQLTRMTEPEVAHALAQLAVDGPSAIVPPENSLVQKKVMKAVLRLAVFGSPAAALDLAKSSVTNRVYRGLLVSAVNAYASKPLTSIAPLVRRALGMADGRTR